MPEIHFFSAHVADDSSWLTGMIRWCKQCQLFAYFHCMEIVYTSSNSHMITVEQTQLYHPKNKATRSHSNNSQTTTTFTTIDTKVLSGVWETNTLSFDAFCCWKLWNIRTKLLSSSSNIKQHLLLNCAMFRL